jgi:hypothetical protein
MTTRRDQTAEDIDAEIKACREKIANMRPSLEKQKILAHLARLRLRLSAKRWVAKVSTLHRPF